MPILYNCILMTLGLMLSSTSPLAIGTTLMFTTSLIVLTSSNLISSWMGFMLFLVFLSGMMVMFAYFITYAPILSPLHISTKLGLAIIIMSMPLSNMAWWMNKSSLPFHLYLLSPPMSSLLITITALLLLCLIMVTKLLLSYSSPLRPFA